jgi:hypothetical protein
MFFLQENKLPALFHFFLCFLATAAPVFSGEMIMKDPAEDKSQFHLFNPTPAAAMREMATDRPDKTESPYTVDAGHVQIESDAVAFTRDRHNPERENARVDEWTFANTNFKLGLFNNVDLQIIVPAYTRSRTSDHGSGVVTHDRGIGDLTFRMKMNLWGNDGGRTAFAAMPFIKVPTGNDTLSNGAVEGGLILPLAVTVGAGWSMGVMTEIDFREDAGDSGYHVDWINSITFSHAIVGELSGYVEFFSLVSGDSEWVGSVDAGITYGVTPNVQLDAGINVGVTRAADDLNGFVGISWRF